MTRPIKLLITGDWHLRGANPRNRIDDYKEAAKAKLRETFKLAEENPVEAILVPGDIFDSFLVAVSVLLEFAALLMESPCRIIATLGNHDIEGYNVASYQRSSLRVLEMLVPQLEICTDPSTYIHLGDPDQQLVAVSFAPYSAKMDKDGYGYSPEVEIPEYYYKIHVAHGMALDHVPPFDKYTLIQHIKTDADLVVTGHDHTGYGLYHRADGKYFLNYGSLLRKSASVAEIERQVTVVLLQIEEGVPTITPIVLQSAKPGEEVLDRSKIEAEKQRQYTMDNFAALVQKNTGQAVLLDINGIVESIAAQDNLPPDVVDLALKKIDDQRAKVA
ncbi:MAG: metallophosphoesterase family protein [Carboxydocellales bacterium]